ncbi:MAG: hypothetical protein IKD31_06145 [Clostridia bacterium]|nr:hypothetical protein [Clostridia bacterium]
MTKKSFEKWLSALLFPVHRCRLFFAESEKETAERLFQALCDNNKEKGSWFSEGSDRSSPLSVSLEKLPEGRNLILSVSASLFERIERCALSALFLSAFLLCMLIAVFYGDPGHGLTAALFFLLLLGYEAFFRLLLLFRFLRIRRRLRRGKVL